MPQAIASRSKFATVQRLRFTMLCYRARRPCRFPTRLLISALSRYRAPPPSGRHDARARARPQFTAADAAAQGFSNILPTHTARKTIITIITIQTTIQIKNKQPPNNNAPTVSQTTTTSYRPTRVCRIPLGARYARQSGHNAQTSGKLETTRGHWVYTVQRIEISRVPEVQRQQLRGGSRTAGMQTLMFTTYDDSDL